LTGLIDSISDERWRAWAKSLPEPRYQDANTLAACLSSLERALEDWERKPGTLDRESRMILLHLANLHHRTIAHLLRREAWDAAEREGGGLVGGALKLVRLTSPEARMATHILGELAGMPAARRRAQLAAINKRADGVARLLDILIEWLLQ
jgi:hypothetical protein